MTSPTQLRDLIARIEAAEEPSAELFWDAYDTLYPDKDRPAIWVDPEKREEWTPEFRKWNDFRLRLEALTDDDVQAWTSAAELFVPEGCTYEAKSVWADALQPRGPRKGYGVVKHHFADDGGLEWTSSYLSLCAHPSLALLAASLKAHLAMMEGDVG